MAQEYAYITGGASGLGKAVAIQLASKGIKSFIADRNTAGAEATAQEIGGDYATVDVTSWESQVAGFKKAVELFGRVDYVFAIAGIGSNDWMRPTQTNGDFQKPNLLVTEVNVHGMLMTVSLGVQQFRRQTVNSHGFRGKVIVAGSVCGVYPSPGLSIYAASKHAVTGLVRSWGPELPAEGITLNCLVPSVMRTNISTPEFFDALESEGLLTPLHGAVDACEQLLGSNPVSGQCFEIGPDYDNGQGFTHPKFATFTDEKHRLVFDRLAVRGVSFKLGAENSKFLDA
ncbi:unnamed protein product [Penicillium pancosmium]